MPDKLLWTFQQGCYRAICASDSPGVAFLGLFVDVGPKSLTSHEMQSAELADLRPLAFDLLQHLGHSRDDHERCVELVDEPDFQLRQRSIINWREARPELARLLALASSFLLCCWFFRLNGFND